MLYSCLKILHIISAGLLLTSFIYCFKLWGQSRQNAAILFDRIQTQNWSIIIPFAIFQLATGFTMVSIKHYALSELWVRGSVIGFLSVIISWFAFIYFLLSAQQSNQYQFFRRLQSAMLVLCTLSFLSMIFFMANRVV